MFRKKHIHQHPLRSINPTLGFGNKPWLIALIIMAITFAVYIPTLGKDFGFVNWDDHIYVGENPLITSFSWDNIIAIFDIKHGVGGNYHPITILSLSVNYKISGLDAGSYHVANLLLHLLNASLVFYLIFLIAKRNTPIAAITALLFAIHPMHVESVAWVSARKDLLYAFFYLGALIFYIKYIPSQNWVQLAISTLLFALSCLSKPSAVVWPLVLPLFDYLLKRKLALKLLIEKLPALAVAFAIGLVNYFTQEIAGAIDAPTYSVGKRLLFACYGLIVYVWKLILPLNLSHIYPKPFPYESLSIVYYVSPIILSGMVALVFLSSKKSRVIVFGSAFYVLNLLLVLQIVSFGDAIIADRYTYVPYIGLFFIIAWAFHLFEMTTNGTFRRLKMAGVALLATYSILFAYLTFDRTKVWKNSETLWTSSLHTLPNGHKYPAYRHRGSYYRSQGRYKEALADLNNAIKLRPNDRHNLASRGALHFSMGNDVPAETDFNHALKLYPDSYKIHGNLGALYGRQRKYKLALKHFAKSLENNPDYADAYLNRAILYIRTGNLKQSQKDYFKYLKLTPSRPAPKVYYGIAINYFKMKNFREALPYFTKAIELAPRNAGFWRDRSYCNSEFGRKHQALQDARKAMDLGAQLSDSYITRLQKGK